MRLFKIGQLRQNSYFPLILSYFLILEASSIKDISATLTSHVIVIAIFQSRSSVYSGIFENNGTISSNGSKGGNGYRAGGGGSGGGSINIFYTMLSSKGTITATAGDRGYGTRANSERINGGIGGAGSITTTELVLEEEIDSIRKNTEYIYIKWHIKDTSVIIRFYWREEEDEKNRF